MDIQKVISKLLLGVRINLIVLKKSFTSKEIKEQLKWAISSIDIAGCELSQNIGEKLKENRKKK